MAHRGYFDEGDRVWLAAKVYRANSEQALVEFTSMEGPFSVRVPLAELALDVGYETEEYKGRATWWARVRHWWGTGVWI